MTDPFAQGLDPKRVLCLITGRWTPADYRAYQKTKHWQRVRDAALRRSGGECEACGRKTRLQVHHKKLKGAYKRLFREREKDVAVLCSRCHKRMD